MGNRYDCEYGKRGRTQREDLGQVNEGRRYRRSSPSDRTMPYDGNEEYFGSSTKFGERSAGRSREFDRSRRLWEDERPEHSQPELGGLRSNRCHRYSQVIGTETRRRQTGVGYSGRSGRAGEERPSRYHNPFEGGSAAGLAEHGRNPVDSLRGSRRN